jgi:hypothetical protein
MTYVTKHVPKGEKPMDDPIEVGFVCRDKRERMIYFIDEEFKEVYEFHEADFQQFLTRFARGKHLKDIETLVEEMEQLDKTLKHGEEIEAKMAEAIKKEIEEDLKFAQESGRFEEYK